MVNTCIDYRPTEPEAMPAPCRFLGESVGFNIREPLDAPVLQRNE